MIEVRAAKELLHIQGWLRRDDLIVASGRDAYLADDLLQEASDSLMMKLGEAANRLSRLDVLEPDGVRWALAVANRNFLIHQYDEINRELTWQILAMDLSTWRDSLQGLFVEAAAVIEPARDPDALPFRRNGQRMPSHLSGHRRAVRAASQSRRRSAGRASARLLLPTLAGSAARRGVISRDRCSHISAPAQPADRPPRSRHLDGRDADQPADPHSTHLASGDQSAHGVG